MKTIHRIIVSALIISKDAKLLMGMKDPSKGGVYPDAWHIPGGGIEAGEDEVTALQREVMEEVGIDITAEKVTLIDTEGTGESEKTLATGETVLCQMSFHVYRVDLAKAATEYRLKLNDDLVKTEWVETSYLSKYKLTPPSVRTFTLLGWL